MAKLALVTGASAGIGLETCALFARNGYRVIALSRKPSGVESAALELTLELESFEQIEGLASKLEAEIAGANGLFWSTTPVTGNSERCGT